MNLELLNKIINFASIGLSVAVLAFSLGVFIYNKVKKHDKKMACEEENKVLLEEVETDTSMYKLVNEIIPLAIKKAEETPLINGPTKKLLALSEILLSCNSKGINFERFKEFISEQIENLITFSKTINARKE